MPVPSTPPAASYVINRSFSPKPHPSPEELRCRVKPKREISPAEKQRYKQRTSVERENSRLKDDSGTRTVRVLGAQRVFAHLMFGVLAITVDQLLKRAGN